MANYDAVSRTNYFEVKDREAFNEAMSGHSCEMFTTDGNPNRIALGAYDDIGSFYSDKTDMETQLSDIIQSHIKEDDACILTIIGHEKLRYLNGYAVVITAHDVRTISVEELAVDAAADMLGVDTFDTQLHY